ncbi:glycosyltransferase, partial [Thioalkalivibrio sp.]|uniref:glycosyltransferase n=1 Tax=Thioalkalivibrio sp. TaxID=2093813 RepID=UPI0012D5715B
MPAPPNLFRPVLDVLIPHYRNPDGLAQSLQSIADQDWLGTDATTARLRVIVLDDGSDAADMTQVEAHCAAFRAQSGQVLDLVHEAQNR